MTDIILTRAGPGRLRECVALVAAFHAVEGVEQTAEKRTRAVEMLLSHPEYGAFDLIEMGGAAVGYLAVAYGFSIEFAGRDAFLDEFFVVEEMRGKGVGGSALRLLMAELPDRGIGALHLEVGADNPGAAKLYAQTGFEERSRYHLMSARLIP